jgi:hypothetical protein
MHASKYYRHSATWAMNIRIPASSIQILMNVLAKLVMFAIRRHSGSIAEVRKWMNSMGLVHKGWGIECGYTRSLQAFHRFTWLNQLYMWLKVYPNEKFDHNHIHMLSEHLTCWDIMWKCVTLLGSSLIFPHASIDVKKTSEVGVQKRDQEG